LFIILATYFRILHKLEKDGKRRRPPFTPATQATSSATTLNTPDSHEAASANGADVAMAELTVEEAMDMNFDSGSEDEAMPHVQDDEDLPRSANASPDEPSLTQMPLDDPEVLRMKPVVASDPRRRRPSEDQDLSNGWDPHNSESNGLGSTGAWTVEL
jgi:hypothetical protein